VELTNDQFANVTHKKSEHSVTGDEEFMHSYVYPGKHTLLLFFFLNEYAKNKDIFSRILALYQVPEAMQRSSSKDIFGTATMVVTTICLSLQEITAIYLTHLSLSLSLSFSLSPPPPTQYGHWNSGPGAC
jgi:hypothetical protein